MLYRPVLLAAITVAVAFAGCAPSRSVSVERSVSEGQSTGSPPAKKRITAAYTDTELTVMSYKTGVTSARWIEQIVHAGLAQVDPQTVLHPQLAESGPPWTTGSGASSRTGEWRRSGKFVPTLVGTTTRH